jgi:hypothetical protein
MEQQRHLAANICGTRANLLVLLPDWLVLA